MQKRVISYINVVILQPIFITYYYFFYKTRKIMERRLSLFFVCLMISIGAAFAQMDVSGTVVSQDDGEPIIGASVSISGGGKICRYCHRY